MSLKSLFVLENLPKDKLKDILKEHRLYDNHTLPVLEFEDNTCYKIAVDTESCYTALKAWVEDMAWSIDSQILSDATGIPQIMYELIKKEKDTESNVFILICIDNTCGMDSFVDYLIDEKNGLNYLSCIDEIISLNDDIGAKAFCVYC